VTDTEGDGDCSLGGESATGLGEFAAVIYIVCTQGVIAAKERNPSNMTREAIPDPPNVLVHRQASGCYRAALSTVELSGRGHALARRHLTTIAAA